MILHGPARITRYAPPNGLCAGCRNATMHPCSAVATVTYVTPGLNGEIEVWDICGTHANVLKEAGRGSNPDIRTVLGVWRFGAKVAA